MGLPLNAARQVCAPSCDAVAVVGELDRSDRRSVTPGATTSPGWEPRESLPRSLADRASRLRRSTTRPTQPGSWAAVARPDGVFLMVDIKASSAVRLGRERHASTAVRLHELRERCNNDHSGGRGIRTHEDGVGPALELFKSSPFGLSGSPPGYPVSHSGRGLYRPATSEAPSRSGNAPARAGGGRWRRTRCPNP
jgi:hypothetical protein